MVPQISVAIPSANRPRLLRETLACLAPHVRRFRMAVLIGENRACSPELRETVDQAARACPEGRFSLIDLTQHSSHDHLQDPSEDPPENLPGDAASTARMLRAVDALYERIETPYVFHCEDDWWLSPEDFLSDSLAILEQYPEVMVVRLTGDEARPLPDQDLGFRATRASGEHVDFHLSRYGGPGGLFGAFTFNPGLRRLADRERWFGAYQRFASEAEISRLAQKHGHREAILTEVYARHTGVGSSTLGAPKRAQRFRGKVFCIGMFKTGTTSFGEAMELLGYRARYRFIPLLDELRGYFDLDPGQFAPFEQRIRREADRFEAFADAPWLYLYRELDRWYPGSLFVLTMRRDAESLARSDLAHWERHGLLRRWHREGGEPLSTRMFTDRYENHNRNVLDYFRGQSHRLLQVCWEEEEDPWNRLCAFLGAAPPEAPFPHANRAPDR